MFFEFISSRPSYAELRKFQLALPKFQLKFQQLELRLELQIQHLELRLELQIRVT